MPSSRIITDDELLRLPKDGRKHELVDGEIVVSPAGYRHGRITVRLSRKLEAFTSSGRLGDVTESSTGFRLPGGNVRCPDVAFVAASRLPQGEPEGFFEGAPDLAVEVLRRATTPVACWTRSASISRRERGSCGSSTPVSAAQRSTGRSPT